MPIIDQLGNRRSGLGGRLQVRHQVRAKRVQRIEAPDVGRLDGSGDRETPAEGRLDC